MAVLIVAGPEDPQGRRVAEELRRLGEDTRFLDAGAFPQHVFLTQSGGAAYVDGRELDVPRAVYLRALACHPLAPGFESELETRPRGLLAQCDEKRAQLESLLLTLERQGARLVNGLDANALHSQKPHQLHILEAAGLPVPKWVATNDPRAVRAFVRDVGNVVYKPLAGGATVRLLEREDLRKERLESLRLAPVLFQERVTGVSVRVYVVGAKVVAAGEIHSAELDYRRGEAEVAGVGLAPDERRAAVRAAKACGMTFAGVDLIRSQAGFRVLECNPSPMFAAFEHKTGLDVAGPLAAVLAGERTHP